MYGKLLYTVRIDYPNGEFEEEKDVYRVETDTWIDFSTPVIRLCYDNDQPKSFALLDGVTIKITEQNVNAER